MARRVPRLLDPAPDGPPGSAQPSLHLESGLTISPADGAAWLAGADGARFATASSAAWGAAAVAAGEDPEAADAAVARTTAAYTASS